MTIVESHDKTHKHYALADRIREDLALMHSLPSIRMRCGMHIKSLYAVKHVWRQIEGGKGPSILTNKVYITGECIFVNGGLY